MWSASKKRGNSFLTTIFSRKSPLAQSVVILRKKTKFQTKRPPFCLKIKMESSNLTLFNSSTMNFMSTRRSLKLNS